MQRISIILLFTILITSCRTQQDVLYFQNIDEVVNNSPEIYNDPGIQTGDELSIIVTAYNDDLARPFNLTNNSSNGNNSTPSYIVDSQGDIAFPMLGNLHVAGKTRSELSSYLEGKISNYIEDPIVNVRINNFRVTMLGEVNSPGIVTSNTDKISIIEAIAKSGDLSMHAIRDSILLIRTVDNVRTKTYINMKDANTINSPYYYLRQNDIVYVMPTKSRATEFNTRPFRDVLTILSLGLTIFAIFK